MTEGRKISAVQGELWLEDVYFAYPSCKDVMVLCGMSIALSPGKVVALVGLSGSCDPPRRSSSSHT